MLWKLHTAEAPAEIKKAKNHNLTHLDQNIAATGCLYNPLYTAVPDVHFFLRCPLDSEQAKPNLYGSLTQTTPKD